MKIKSDKIRILLIRTDRIGDVLLSTPVIKAVRDAYPDAYIAMMVRPYAADIVRGNPYLDEVILYDRDGAHKGVFGSLMFALGLRKKGFDLAIILHPTNRSNVIPFLAGIPERVGYDKKGGVFLTKKLKDVKHLGEKHELEYTLDLVRCLGIEPKDKSPFMPIRPESEAWAEELLRREGINRSDKLLAIHPAASCVSRIWPPERFAELADRLADKYGFKVLVISGPEPGHIKIAGDVIARMRHSAVNLAGRTSVSQLASILKRCRLHVSTDTGPMHIASGVGTPVIAVFGRKQKGLSPRRWGPRGEKSRVLHKDVGCIECLAHNCKINFKCLDAITVEDVLSAADALLKKV